MGLDYIRAQTGKPWRKRWDGGLDRLEAPTLLDLTMSEGRPHRHRQIKARLPNQSRRHSDCPEHARRPYG
jgi:hypothetical protein